MNDLKIRPADSRDVGFIMNSWLKSYKSEWFLRYEQIKHLDRYILDQMFFENHQKVLTEIFKREGVRCFVAALPDDDEVIVGYVVCEHPNKIHYIYVKKKWRDNGIARKLFDECGLTTNYLSASHWSFHAERIHKRFNKIIYNPYY